MSENKIKVTVEYILESSMPTDIHDQGLISRLMETFEDVDNEDFEFQNDQDKDVSVVVTLAEYDPIKITKI